MGNPDHAILHGLPSDSFDVPTFPNLKLTEDFSASIAVLSSNLQTHSAFHYGLEFIICCCGLCGPLGTGLYTGVLIGLSRWPVLVLLLEGIHPRWKVEPSH